MDDQRTQQTPHASPSIRLADTALHSSLLQLRGHLSIVHHIHGRVRLRLAASALGQSQALATVRALSTQLAMPAAIRQVSVNAAARSVLIEYDPQRLPDSFWPQLLQAPAEQALALLQQHLAP